MSHSFQSQFKRNLPLILTSLSVITVFALALVVNQHAQTNLLRAEEQSCKAYYAKPGPQPYVNEIDPDPGFIFFNNYVWEVRNDLPCADGANRKGNLEDGSPGGQTECSQKLGVPIEQAWCYGFGANNESPYCIKYIKPVSACTEVKPPTPTPVADTGDNTDNPPPQEPAPTSEPRNCADGPDLDGSWSTNCNNKCTPSGSQGQGIAFDASTLTSGDCEKGTAGTTTYCYPFKDGNYCTSKKADSAGGDGDTSGGVSNAASITKLFVNNINAVCKPNVSSFNRSCITSISVPGPARNKQIVVRDFQQIVDAYTYLQCVTFAKNAFLLYAGCQPYTSGFSCDDDRSVGNANEYVKHTYVNANQVSPSATPKEGDLIIFRSNHIAVVSEVLNNSVTICEGNQDIKGNSVCWRSIPRDSGDIAGYLRYNGKK